MKEWNLCRNVLVVRPDNIGDLIMSGPAIRALKQTFNCRITLLTSPSAAVVAGCMPCIDEVIVAAFPWVKNDLQTGLSEFNQLCKRISERGFDGAVIFSVYSQSVLPTALLLQLSGIPLRLAYNRENPYQLLTHWVPDPEPYTFIRHQVERDLQLVKTIGATLDNDRLMLTPSRSVRTTLLQTLIDAGIDPGKPWVIVHMGVSETKREYLVPYWKQVMRGLTHTQQVLLTGSSKECDDISTNFHRVHNVFNLAGKLSMEQFIELIGLAPLVITVNTSSAHIAAAMESPLLLLYALTNPQHLPWKAKGCVLFFSVPEELKSLNEVVRYVDRMHPEYGYPSPQLVYEKAMQVLSGTGAEVIPVLAPLRAGA